MQLCLTFKTSTLVLTFQQLYYSQKKLAGNDVDSKKVILQPKAIDNNIMEKSSVDPLIEVD